MPSKGPFSYTFSTSSGAQTAITVPGGLYKYAVDATFGTSATMKVEIGFDGNYVDAYDISQTAITDTSSSAVNKSYDFYVPYGCTVRLNITANSITSGDAYISQIYQHNG